MASRVKEIVPGSEVTYAADASPDTRNYRVNCDKISHILPEFKPTWTVRQGIEELYEDYKANEITEKDFFSSRYLRISAMRCIVLRVASSG